MAWNHLDQGCLQEERLGSYSQLDACSVWFSSVAQLCPTLGEPMVYSMPSFPVHPSPTREASSNSCPSSQWCPPTISSSVAPFSCLQYFRVIIRVFPSELVLRIRWPKYWSFSSATVLPMNIQDWFPLGWTGWISLLSKGLSRVFSNTTVQKDRFFGAQLSLWSNSYIHTWLLEKP